MWTFVKAATLVLCFIVFVEGQLVQRGFQVSIENLSGGSLLPTAFSEVVWAVHAADANPLFTVGQLASPHLRTFAQQGDGTDIAALLGNSSSTLSFGRVSGGAPNLRGFSGSNGIAPGTTVNFGIRGKPGDRFSFVTRFYESNDAFFGVEAGGFSLFGKDGQPTGGVVDAILYSAGTQAQENPGSGLNQDPRRVPGSLLPNFTAIAVSAVSSPVYPPAASVIRITITPAIMFRLRVENIGNGTALSPPAWAVSLSRGTFFTLGAAASAGLRNLAENGNPTLLVQEARSQSTVLFAGAGSTSPLTPGTFAEFQIPAVAGSVLHFATMYGQSNDRFFATPDSGIPLFESAGPLIDTSVSALALYDAGTALNELPGKGANQVGNRAGPNTLPSTNGVVKNALYGNPDGFIYQSRETTLRLSINPQVDLPGYGSTSPTQNVFVSFSFNQLIQTKN